MKHSREPIRYKTPEELQQRITEYFDLKEDTRTVVTKAWLTVEVFTPTITGLALYLWFESRQSFYDYEKNEKYSYTIKKARTIIENEYEKWLQVQPTWNIFALKNFWWTDKQEIDQTTTMKVSWVNISIDGD